MPEITSSHGAALRHALLLALHQDRERGSLRPAGEYRALFPGLESEVEALLAEFLVSEPLGTRSEPETRVGRYKILAELGRGGQGVVYLAEDEALARRVALKMLAPRFALDPLAEARFRREAVAASRLAHPGVCTVHDVGEAGGLPYIAMEYIPGTTLAQRLAAAGGESPRGGELAARLALVEQVARTLAAVHAAGVLHRDLKPTNVLLRANGEPVLVDFGLAHDASQPVSLTLSGDVFGTPAYMAPEQIEGRRSAIGPRTDVYALGALLYECLTGERPFRAPTRRALYRAILFEEPADPRARNPQLGRDLALVIKKALAKEPPNRYAGAAELADDLTRVREHRPVRAQPAGRWLRFRRWCRRDPVLAATAVGLLVALLGAFGVTDALGRRTRAAELERLRQSDRHTLALLEQELGECWPILPEGVPAMERWLGEVEALAARWSDPESADSSLREGLARLPAWIEEVHARRTEALAIPGRSLEAHRAEWAATRAAIADRARHPAYAGLALEPQVGLVPLGRDPVSGLFEFAHLQTGAVPERDQAGHLIVTEEMGLVFVLLPGGWFTMGSCMFPGHPHEWEHEVLLEPFFLSKYEMTQGQWLRVRGENPSEYAPGGLASEHELKNLAGLAFDLRHPVERVSWLDCAETVRRLGLTLPTEAQWEYGARGGTRTTYWSGWNEESLRGVANLYDRSRALAGESVEGVAFDDGFCFHAPVGSLAANPFGLHDVHGNVWEWVRERIESYRNPVRAGDGERIGAGEGQNLLRGGSFGDLGNFARVIVRYEGAQGSILTNRGLRPARAIRSAATRGGP